MGSLGSMGVVPDEPLPVDSPFFALDNCTVLPHMAAVTRDARLRQSEPVASRIAELQAEARADEIERRRRADEALALREGKK